MVDSHGAIDAFIHGLQYYRLRCHVCSEHCAKFGFSGLFYDLGLVLIFHCCHWAFVSVPYRFKGFLSYDVTKV